MSADKVTSLAGGLSGSGLGSLTGALQGGVNNLVNMGSGWLDKFFPPEKREEWKAWLTKFATEKPYLASFLLSQIALSGLPLALFAFMTVTVFIFALLAGILIGVLGALLFVVAAVGFALLILLPILFFTTGAAVFIWLWGVGAYYIVKWFNQKDVPGIHTDAAGGLAKATGLSDLPGINGTPLGGGGENGSTSASASGDEAHPSQHQQHANNSNSKGQRTPAKLDKKGTGTGTTTGAQQHHHDAKEPNSHTNAHQRKQVNRPSSTGPASKVTDTVDGAGKTANGTVGDARKVVGI
ncbi:hypothetical protein A1O1_03558 [Capronia coronata CBS 617.96]|uniref:Uncharacterized protein n=1 Tax=Capronia coronata CBS 617.96 TaxID=1182541 RepID=W9YMK3_9EURO|nr:uncharacterized protein A1O1_03558 [Capronia coronata CBS 617.96]EXJ90456.1 hypothetical protein A1O1_03558 [Capronia coronata CBS 617.96]